MTTTQNWQFLNDVRQTEIGELRSQAVAPADSPWFSGHFPQEPILPGIAQLYFIFATVNQLNNQRLRVCGFKKVRFRQAVRPGDIIQVKASPGKKTGQHQFALMVGDETVCTGILLTELQPD